MKPLPGAPTEYDQASQNSVIESIRSLSSETMKLGQANFLKAGEVSLQSANGKWWVIGVDNSGNLTTTELTGTRIDSDGRPIQTTNPYA